MLDLRPDSFYRREARALARLRGTVVGDEDLSLADVVFGPGWAVEELLLDGVDGPRRVPLDGIALPVPRRVRTA